MKKTLSFLALAFVATSLFAQDCETGKTLPWTDNFMSTDYPAFPSCWTIIETPGNEDGENGHWLNGILKNPSINIAQATGESYAIITWGDGKNYRHNTWLVTPALSMEAGKRYRIEFPIYMIERAPNHEELTVTIAMGNDAPTLLAGTQLFQSLNKNHAAWTKITVEYTAQTSGKHFIGFHATGGRGDGQGVTAIESIKVTPVETYVDNDLVIDVPMFTYTQVPRRQFPTVTATNAGKVAQPNVKLTATINGGTAIGTSAPMTSLATGATAEFSLEPTGEIPLGATELTLSVSSDSTNSKPTNTQTLQYETTNNVYAADDGTGGSLAGAPGIAFGNIFRIYNTTSLAKVMISFAYKVGYQVGTYRLSLQKVNNRELVGEPLFSLEFQKPDSGSGLWITHDVPTTLLTPGDYFLSAAQKGNIYLDLHLDGTGNTCYIDRNYGLLETPVEAAVTSFLGAAMLRMVTDEKPFTTPANDATNVAIDGAVRVSFSTPVVLDNPGAITISPAVQNLFPMVDGTVLTISHADFQPNTRYTVTVPVGSVGGYEEEISWSFTTGTHTTGIANNLEISNLCEFYPNPVGDLLHIKTTQNLKKIEVFNAQGQRLKTLNGARSIISMWEYPAGLYLLRITTDAGVEVQRVVKK